MPYAGNIIFYFALQTSRSSRIGDSARLGMHIIDGQNKDYPSVSDVSRPRSIIVGIGQNKNYLPGSWSRAKKVIFVGAICGQKKLFLSARNID